MTRTIARASAGCTVIAAALGAAMLLAGCSPEDRQTAATALGTLAQAEQVDFHYLVLEADETGDYPLSLDPGTGCQTVVLPEATLADALRTRQLEVTRTVGGGPVTSQVAFDFGMLERCNTPGEVKFETDQLSEAATDGSGNAIRRRPQSTLGADDVTIRFSASGEVRVWLRTRGFNLSGQVASGTKAPGAMSVNVAEIDGSLVGRPGAAFAAATAPNPYTDASVLQMRTNPAGFTARFEFLAKDDQQEPQLLLVVWDGDITVRTDL